MLLASSPARSPIHHAPKPLLTVLTTNLPAAVSNMLNRLHGQPESYDKKYVSGFPLDVRHI